MQRALNASLADLPLDDTERAQLLSMQEFEEKQNMTSAPTAVQTCVEMGFDRSKAEAAYTLFAGDNLEPDALLATIVRYLSDPST